MKTLTKTLTITTTTHRKGNTTEAYTAKAIYGNTRIRATYDVLTGNIIIDKWYLLPDAELSALRDALTNHFKQISA